MSMRLEAIIQRMYGLLFGLSILLFTLFLSGHWFSVMGIAKCRRLAGKPS
jgi:hypothetical protein